MCFPLMKQKSLPRDKSPEKIGTFPIRQSLPIFGMLVVMMYLLISCGSSKEKPESDVKNDSIFGDQTPTAEEIKARRPRFPGFEANRTIFGRDAAILTVVTNRKFLQKAWMVYYDLDKERWDTLTWMGKGQNYKVIAKHRFSGRNGVYGGASTSDAPEIYAGYSLDNGRSWKPYKLYNVWFFCPSTDRRGKQYEILASLAPGAIESVSGIAIIIDRKTTIFDGNQLDKIQAAGYCSALAQP